MRFSKNKREFLCQNESYDRIIRKLNKVFNNHMFHVQHQTLIQFITTLFYIQMGICPIFGSNNQSKSPSNTKSSNGAPVETERPLYKVKDPDKQINQAVIEEKKGSVNEVSLNNSKGQSIAKHASTGIGLSECDRKASSFFSQVNTFESSSIIVKNPKEKFNEPNVNEGDFYTLIDKVFFIRKTLDSIKVSSPHNQSELKCPYKSLLSTVYLSEGLPLESIKEISMGKIIQTTNSPIKITLKISCKQCQRKIKLTYAKSFIDMSQLSCDKCKTVTKWALDDIISNVPVWGDGRKIQNNECLETVPSPLRALGCIYCMRYADCEQLPCQCFACKICLQQNKTKQCHICQAVE